MLALVFVAALVLVRLVLISILYRHFFVAVDNFFVDEFSCERVPEAYNVKAIDSSQDISTLFPE